MKNSTKLLIAGLALVALVAARTAFSACKGGTCSIKKAAKAAVAKQTVKVQKTKRTKTCTNGSCSR